MANPKKTRDLVFKLLKGQDPKRGYRYEKQPELVAEELFDNQVCRKTRDLEGKEVPMVNKQGDPVYYQLQYFLDSEEENLTGEQKEIFLQDPRYKDPITGKVKTFPHKTLLSMVRVQTEADNKEWLKAKFVWEGLRRDKQIEVSPIFEVGVYDHPIPVTELRQIEPKDKDSPYRSVITAMNYQKMYDIPFTKENVERELAKRDAPRDERHIGLSLMKVGPSGINNPTVLQVTDKEQWLNRPFNELFDYLASAPLKNTLETKIGQEKNREKNKHYA